MIPQYQPSAAYRQLEFLLDRIDNLGERSDFTTQTGNYGNSLNFTTANDSNSGYERMRFGGVGVERMF
jgi:carboxypeptidase D